MAVDDRSAFAPAQACKIPQISKDVCRKPKGVKNAGARPVAADNPGTMSAQRRCEVIRGLERDNNRAARTGGNACRKLNQQPLRAADRERINDMHDGGDGSCADGRRPYGYFKMLYIQGGMGYSRSFKMTPRTDMLFLRSFSIVILLTSRRE